MNRSFPRSRSCFTMLSLLALAVSSAACGSSSPADPADHGEGGEEEVATTASAISVSDGPKARWYSTASFQEAQKLKDVLADLASSNTEILGMTASPQGGWVITTETGYFTGGTLPNGMAFWLSLLLNQGQTLRAVSINEAGGYVITGHSTYHTGGAVPQNARDKIAQYYANGWQIRDIDITDVGYVILGSGTLASYANVDADLMQVLADRARSKRTVQQVEIGFGGEWAAVAGQQPATEGVSSQLRGTLDAAARGARHMSRLMMGPNGSYVLYSHGNVTATPGSAIEAIEYGTASTLNLWEWMAATGVPGLSIAIIENNQVAFARGYGVLRQGQDKAVLASTPFDVASLSKFTGALTMVKLDADDAYDFDIDDSVVNAAKAGGVIEGWIASGGAQPGTYQFPSTAVSTQLTTANFMRHQTDFVPSNGSPGFPEGSAALNGKTAWDYLMGWDCSSGCGYNGQDFAWSAGGNGVVQPKYDSVNFLVPQAVAEDVAGKSAAKLLEDYFFTPMGLTDITARTDSPVHDRAAWQHSNAGPSAARQVFPWTFAGGVFASPSDYAELMILALNQGRDSSGVERLPASAVNRMLEVPVAGSAAGFGLFSDLPGDITETNDNAFLHNGSHSGLTRSYMCGNPSRNAGIVVVFNADIADGPDADAVNETVELQNYIINRYSAAVGWPGDCF